MMFLFHIAFALGLIALAFGVYFVVWAGNEKGTGVGMAKTFGYIILILAIISLLCTIYYNFKLWKAGYYQVMPRMIISKPNQSTTQPTMMQKIQMQHQQQRAKQQSRANQNPANNKAAAQKHKAN